MPARFQVLLEDTTTPVVVEARDVREAATRAVEEIERVAQAYPIARGETTVSCRVLGPHGARRLVVAGVPAYKAEDHGAVEWPGVHTMNKPRPACGTCPECEAPLRFAYDDPQACTICTSCGWHELDEVERARREAEETNR